MASADYSARHLSVLEGLEAVRKRPGMYIGSTDSRGLMHCLWEIIDNSVDEALAGHGTDIEVILHADESVEVRDTRPRHPGRHRAEDRALAASRWSSPSCTPAASSAAARTRHPAACTASARRSSTRSASGSTSRSTATARPGRCRSTAASRASSPTPIRRTRPRTRPFAPFVSGSELRVVGKVAKNVTGTRIRYWADPQIFTKGATFQRDELLERARQTAFLVPGLGITRRRPAAGGRMRTRPRSRRSGSRAASASSSTSSSPDEPLTSTWRIQGTGAYTETVPVLQENGHMVATEVSRECEVDIALRWGTGYDTVFRSFVNIIATPKGGTHQTGFEQGLMKFLRAEVEKNARRLKVGTGANSTDKLEKEDILAGLTAVLTVRIAEPQFEGQTKEILGTPAIRNIVANTVAKAMGERFASSKRDDKAQSRARAREDRRRDEEPHLGAGAQRDPAPQERARVLVAAGEARRLPVERRRSAPSCSSSRAIRRSARPSSRATASSRRCCRSAARSSTCRRRRSATCCRNAECASIIQVIGAGSGRAFDIDAGALRQGHHHERRRRRRRPHPHPAAHPVLQVHARDDREAAGCTPPSRRCTASSCMNPGIEAERDHLHVLRARS